jgi:hypothetical protein
MIEDFGWKQGSWLPVSSNASKCKKYATIGIKLLQ